MTMKTAILTALICFFTVSAYAAPSESYYQQQFKSCVHYKRERTGWRDLLEATRPVVTDQCCWDSVEAMKSVNARRVKDDACPNATVRTQLNCPTSKSWCAPKAK